MGDSVRLDGNVNIGQISSLLDGGQKNLKADKLDDGSIEIYASPGGENKDGGDLSPALAVKQQALAKSALFDLIETVFGPKMLDRVLSMFNVELMDSKRGIDDDLMGRMDGFIANEMQNKDGGHGVTPKSPTPTPGVTAGNPSISDDVGGVAKTKSGNDDDYIPSYPKLESRRSNPDVTTKQIKDIGQQVDQHIEQRKQRLKTEIERPTPIKPKQVEQDAQKIDPAASFKPKAPPGLSDVQKNLISQFNDKSGDALQELVNRAIGKDFPDGIPMDDLKEMGFDQEAARQVVVSAIENADFSKMTVTQTIAFIDKTMEDHLESVFSSNNEDAIADELPDPGTGLPETMDDVTDGLEEISEFLKDRRTNNEMQGQLFLERMEKRGEMGKALKDARGPLDQAETKRLGKPVHDDLLGSAQGFSSDAAFDNNETGVSLKGARKAILKAFSDYGDMAATLSESEKRDMVVNAMKDYIALPPDPPSKP